MTAAIADVEAHMPEKGPDGKFVKSEPAEGPSLSDVASGKVEEKLVHPALRPRKRPKKTSKKMRRTTVRTVKLINPTDENKPQLIQLPCEPSHNNGGSLSDPTIPIRFYLNKGYVWPHEFDAEKYPKIYCAIYDCWDWTNDDTERCQEHDEMFQAGLIRYATSSKDYRE